MQQDIDKAIEILRAGGIILYPTDTVWGIGCDATNADAVSKIYKLKQREETKSMLVLVENQDRILRHVKEVPEMAWQLIELSEKPITIIYPGACGLAANLISEDKTIGIRVASDEFCQKLIGRLNRPLVSTSANISGNTAPSVFAEIQEEIKQGVDYVVQWRQDDLTRAQPSSIVKLGVNNEFDIIRK
jgi:L-threonylcarbamoyladenylate synthase